MLGYLAQHKGEYTMTVKQGLAFLGIFLGIPGLLFSVAYAPYIGVVFGVAVVLAMACLGMVGYFDGE